MYCIECGVELQDNSRFCSACGSNQTGDNQNITERTILEKSSRKTSTGINIINSIFKSCIIIIIIWVAYSYQEHSKLDRFKNMGDNQYLILDSKTGEVWIIKYNGWGDPAIIPEQYSKPINKD